MELSTLDIDPAEASERLAEYEALIAGERTAEDLAIAAGYRAAARGLPIISLTQTIQAGGFHDNGLPRIAVINADATMCYAYWDGKSIIYQTDDDWRANRGALVGRKSVRIPVAEPPADRRGHNVWRMGSAPVPIIPPKYRPRLRRLRHFHVLWEVEEWARVVSRDPALLRHIRGDLWAVHATWDLTELERLVLTQRFAS